MEAMTRVSIAVQPRPYQAIIQTGLLAQAGSCLHDLLGANKKLFVVTVPPVRRRWGKKLLASLSTAGFSAKILTMPDGERYKKIVWTFSFDDGTDRHPCRSALNTIICKIQLLVVKHKLHRVGFHSDPPERRLDMLERVISLPCCQQT